MAFDNESREIPDKKSRESIDLPPQLKQKLEEVKRRSLEKAKEESAIFYDGVYYGQVPVELLRDPKIKLQAKAVYTLLHSYSNPKSLISKPQTFVSKMKLAADAGMRVDRLRGWMKRLEEAGWLTTKRRGLNISNNYILHARRRRKR